MDLLDRDAIGEAITTPFSASASDIAVDNDFDAVVRARGVRGPSLGRIGGRVRRPWRLAAPTTSPS